jgi:hypothetical protein
MAKDVKDYNTTGEIDKLSCHCSIYPAVNNLDIKDDKNAEVVSNPLTDAEDGFVNYNGIKNLKSNYQDSTESPEGAVFGKTVAVFGDGAHSAVFYGQSKDGTRYYYSKNGQQGAPTISTESELQKNYGTKIQYFNPINNK